MPALRSKFRRWILRTWLAALSVCAVAAAGGGSSLRQAVRLDDEWKTFLGNPAGAETKEFDDHAWKPVSVPHNWEDYQGYHQKSHGNLHGTAWYRRAFVPDVLLAGKRLFVEFAGVGSYATVWLNGHPVGGHKGGRTGFTIDLSEHVVFGQTNWLAVRADHPEKLNDLPYICGGCWGTPNTEGSQPFGIFRPVRLLATEAVRVIPFGVQVWTPEISESRAVVEIKTEVNNHDSTPRQVSVRSEILDAAGAVIARVESQAVTLAPGELHTFDQTSPALAKPHLWSLDDPYLHRVRTTVLEEGRPVDALDTRFGMRWISWPIANEESGVSARTIDPAKLAELPGPTNNNFTVIAEGRGTNGLQIVPQGVEVLVPECSPAQARVRVRTTVTNSGPALARIRLTSFIRNFDGTKFITTMETDRDLAPGEGFTFDQTSTAINFPERWSPENPYLHTVETTLEDPAVAGTKRARIFQKAETSFGILETGGLANKASAYLAQPTSEKSVGETSRQFLLNGRPVFINGTSEYEHLLGNDHAFTDGQITARMSQIKAAGFNALREAHHPHNLRYLELCDELGLLNWTQIDAHIYFDTDAFRENFRAALREWVRERRNSPSVVLWGLQNESVLPTVFARELTQMVRELDPTASSQRKTTTCNGGSGSDWNVPQNWLGTYGGNVNDYGSNVVAQQLVGEYGQWRTIGLHQEGDWAETWGAKQGGRVVPEELFNYCLETKVRLAEENRDQFCGHFQWIFSTHANPGRSEKDGCADGLGLDAVGVVNYKGLLTSWGEPLDAFYMYRANYAPKEREPMVFICSHTWPDRFTGAGVKSNLVVFSNCEEVELFNDYRTISLGVKKRGAIGTHFEWDNVDIQFDVLYAEGRIKGKTVATDLIQLKNLPAAPAQARRKLADTDDLAPVPGATYLHRVNCGGTNYTDTHGKLWKADQTYIEGSWGSLSWARAYPELDPMFASVRRVLDPIAGTRDDELFQTFRYGRDQLVYRLPVPNGRYQVELYFIEPWYGIGGGLDCTGWRLFDVAINGRTEIHDLDIWKEAGCERVLKKILPVTVTNGLVEISFPKIKSYQAVISAVAVRQGRN